MFDSLINEEECPWFCCWCASETQKSHEFELKMADHGIEPSGDDSEVSQTLGNLESPHSEENNGHCASSPEESFSPTSVIYFKEALSAANIQFANKGSPSPTPVRYEFHIERTKKTKSKCTVAWYVGWIYNDECGYITILELATVWYFAREAKMLFTLHNLGMLVLWMSTTSSRPIDDHNNIRLSPLAPRFHFKSVVWGIVGNASDVHHLSFLSRHLNSVAKSYSSVADYLY